MNDQNTDFVQVEYDKIVKHRDNNKDNPIDTIEKQVYLQEPFYPTRVFWKPGATTKAKDKALAFPYIDARDLLMRLDKIIGIENYMIDRKEVNGEIYTGLGINFDPGTLSNNYIWRWEPGYMDDRRDGRTQSTVLGVATVGLRRACAAFGIGRYLYFFPKTWVDYDKEKKKLLQIPDLTQYQWCLPFVMRTEKNGNAITSSDEEIGETTIKLEDIIEEDETNITAGTIMNELVQNKGVDSKKARAWMNAQIADGLSIEDIYDLAVGEVLNIA